MGSFTTGAANSEAAGYFLIDAMTVNSIVDSTNKTWGPFVATSFPFGPSYNPTTQLFTNFDRPAQAHLLLDTTSFIISKHYFFAALTDQSGPFPFPPATTVYFPGTADLSITAAATSVPEPTTLFLLGTGLLGAVVTRRRARAS